METKALIGWRLGNVRRLGVGVVDLFVHGFRGEEGGAESFTYRITRGENGCCTDGEGLSAVCPIPVATNFRNLANLTKNSKERFRER